MWHLTFSFSLFALLRLDYRGWFWMGAKRVLGKYTAIIAYHRMLRNRTHGQLSLVPCASTSAITASYTIKIHTLRHENTVAMEGQSLKLTLDWPDE